MAIREWSVGRLLLFWAGCILCAALLFALYAATSFRAGQTTQLSDAIVLGIWLGIGLWLPTLVTARWIGALRHRGWPRSKILLLWGWAAAAVLAVRATFPRDWMNLLWAFGLPLFVLLQAITWTWLTARTRPKE